MYNFKKELSHMIKQLEVTVLVNDRVDKAGFLAEHGFSCWVDTGENKFLFDTGGGLVLDHNARLLDIRLDHADAVILSHGHDDHSGGLSSVFRRNPDVTVGVHPHAFTPRFIREEEGVRANSFSRYTSSSIAKECGRLVLTESPTELFPGVSVTGTTPREYNTEHLNAGYYLDASGTLSDPFTDDQAAFIETEAGTVVLVGCAHSGLANIMEHVADLTGRRRIHAIIGGLHLSEASGDTMDNVLDMLVEFDVKMLGMAHCTGVNAETVFRTKFPSRCAGVSVGSRIQI